MPQDELDIFDLMMAEVGAAVKPRNVFAHDNWGWSPDAPDAICFTPKSEGVRLSLELERRGRERDWSEEVKVNLDATMVYRQKDITDSADNRYRQSQQRRHDGTLNAKGG